MDIPQSKSKSFEKLFKPETIAVLGASAKSATSGNRLLKILADSGFSGRVYPIHPKASKIEGVRTYPSLQEVPERIDYAFVCVGAEAVPHVIRQASGIVNFMQVMTSGFSEDADGQDLQRELENAVRSSDVRLLGPNCIGLYSSPGRVSFIENTLFEDGNIAVLSQSGGLAIDILRRGQQLGLCFSSIVSLGNSIDLGSTELLEHHLGDPDVKAIGLYIENVRDGRKFFNLLAEAKCEKPVVILKGGRTGQGQRAAASHTGAMADNDRIWDALALQTGAVIVSDLGRFLDLLVLFQAYTPTRDVVARDVILIGNGGGTSVLAADHFAWEGLSLHAYSPETARKLARIDVPAGSSLRNPIDLPANALKRDGGQIVSSVFDEIFKDDEVGALVMHLNLTVLVAYDSEVILTNTINALTKVRKQTKNRTQVMLVLRSDLSRDTITLALQFRDRAKQVDIPVFEELADAAKALGAFKSLASFKYSREKAKR